MQSVVFDAIYCHPNTELIATIIEEISPTFEDLSFSWEPWYQNDIDES